MASKRSQKSTTWCNISAHDNDSWQIAHWLLKRSYYSLVGWGGSIEMVMNFPATDCLHICIEPLGKLFHAVGVLPDALDGSLSQPFLSEKRLLN
ncbi:MAG: hypothetical protein AAEJ16_06365 [Arenicellales bacterium]